MADRRERRDARPPEEKNADVDLAVGDTQCSAKHRLDAETVKFCRMSDGHAAVDHETFGGIRFSTAS